MRFCPSVPLHHCPRAGQNEHSRGLPVPPRPSSKRQGPPHNKRRHTDNAYPGQHTVIRRRRGRTILLPDDDTEIEEQIWERKLRARKKIADDNNEKPCSHESNPDAPTKNQEVTLFQTEIFVTQGPPKATDEYDGPMKTMRQQQDQDNVLRNYKLRLLKEPHNEHFLANDPRAAKYSAQANRIILKDGLLYRQYYDHAGKVKFLQTLLPEHLVDSFILAHHGQANKHPGIAKVIQQCREKYYYPGMASRIAHHISRCTEGMQTQRTDKRSITPPMIDTSKLALGPEDALQMDIVPFDEPSVAITRLSLRWTSTRVTSSPTMSSKQTPPQWPSLGRHHDPSRLPPYYGHH